MKCLGVESTAHTFSCAVVDRKGKRGEILSDIRKIYGPPETNRTKGFFAPVNIFPSSM